jgi:hypothetical protein
MEFGKRLRSRIWRGSVDEEVDAEFEFHVEMRVRESWPAAWSRLPRARRPSSASAISIVLTRPAGE